MTGDREIQFSLPVNYFSRLEDSRKTDTARLGNRNTALLSRNTSNMGYPGVLEWRKDSPYSRVLGLFEHVPRMRRIIDENIVPLFEAARSISMQIMYVLDGWEAAQNYPQWQQINARVPSDSGCYWWPYKYSPNTEWIRQFEDDVFMPGYSEAIQELNKVIDVAPPLKPQSDDWVVTTSRQALTLLYENGIWNTLHAGFDTQNEMMYSLAAGIYRFGGASNCIILTDCTTGVERHDTIGEELLKDMTIAFMEVGPALSALGIDVRSGICEALGEL